MKYKIFMKKTEIIKKYIEIYGKRPTLQIDKNMSADEKFKIKQTTKLNQFKWTLKKQIFVEVVEKIDLPIEDKIEFATIMTNNFSDSDLLKIFHGYSYKLDFNNKTYTLFIQD